MSWSTSGRRVGLARCEASLGPPVEYLLAVPGWCFFCGSFVLFVYCVCQLSLLFIAAIWSPEGKGLTSSLVFVMFIVIFLHTLDGCKHNILRVHEGGHKMTLSLAL